jgi:hypothetical protein
MDNAGNLLVNIKAGAAGGGAVYGPTASGSSAANPPVLIGGTATGVSNANVVVSAVKLASTAAQATDTSLVTNESPNSTLTTNTTASAAVEGTTSDTPYAGSGNSTLSAALRGIYAAVTSSIPSGSNLIGYVTPAPTAGQGCTAYHLSGGTTASTNSNAIKASTGTLCELTIISTSATLGYLKLYNLTSATCSSATGLVHVIPIPASATGGGFVRSMAMGEAYGTGISYCVTGGGGDTDNTNAPTGIFIEGSYK